MTGGTPCTCSPAHIQPEWKDILDVLDGFVAQERARSSSAAAANRKSPTRLTPPFTRAAGRKRSFKTTFHVDDEERNSRTHKIDCYKNLVGLELEWNSKDQTFVRDLDNSAFSSTFRYLTSVSSSLVAMNCSKSSVGSGLEENTVLARLTWASSYPGCPAAEVADARF